MMLTPEQIDGFMSVNMNTAEVGALAEISAVKLDNSLPKEKRMDSVLEKLGNPFCFRYSNMGIKLEFDDNALPLAEVLINYLIREKSGL